MQKIKPTPQMEKLLAKYTMEYCVSLLEQDDLAVARLFGTSTGIRPYDRIFDGGMLGAKKTRQIKRTNNEGQSEQKSRSAKA